MLINRSRTLATAAIVVVAALSLTACAGGDAGPGPSNSGAPVAGGEIVVGGLATSALDPGQLGYSNQSRPYTVPILGSLILPPLEAGQDFRPGIASEFGYNDDNTEFTLTIREGATYQDGTAIDADSVAWNLKRNTADGLSSSQYFVDVTDVRTEGADTVVIDFSEPYALMPDALAFTTAGYLVSPTALEKMGDDKFNQAPVGAGPFEVQSVDPGHELVLVKSPTYWDAEHVYLDKVTWINTNADAQATLVKLQSGAVQSVTFAGATTSPAVLSSAVDDPSIVTAKTAATNYQLLAVNTFQKPFDDLRAREAVAYCMDRDSLAKNASQGYADPAYVISGSDSNYLPGGWEDGKALNPYQHDIDKGTALVEELGGLSFSLETNVNSTLITALQQQWAECGIDAKITVTDSYLTDIQKGNYEMGFATSTSGYNPSFSTVFQDPNAALGKYGFKDDGINADINHALGLPNGDEGKTAWREIWKSVNDLAVSIPLLSAPTYVFSSKCLAGVGTYTNQGGVYDNAYLTC